MMKEQLLDLPTRDGAMDTFVSHPEENGPFPAVVIFMDVWGLREELFDLARRVATVGYYCLVPNLYYRQGRVRNAMYGPDGRMISFDRLDEAEKRRVLDPLQRMTSAMVVRDAAAIVDFVRSGEPARPGAMGAIGYCMGGRHVLTVAGHFPETFRANASLHGTSLVSDRPDSPHLLADRMQGELYCGFGAKDPYAAPEVIAALGQSLGARPGLRYRYEVHPDADHGYALPDRDVYDKRAANRDWELIFSMFRRQIPPS